jgi:hypothetical protein
VRPQAQNRLRDLSAPLAQRGRVRRRAAVTGLKRLELPIGPGQDLKQRSLSGSRANSTSPRRCSSPVGASGSRHSGWLASSTQPAGTGGSGGPALPQTWNCAGAA